MIAYKPGQRRRIRPEVGDSGSGAQVLAVILRLYGRGQSDGEEGKEVASSKEEKVAKMAKKKKLDLHEVASDSENFIKSNMFFLDLMLPIIQKFVPPTTSDESTTLIRNSIFEYETALASKLAEEPFRTVFLKTKAFLGCDNNFSHLKYDGEADVLAFTSLISSVNLEEGKFGYENNKFAARSMATYRQCIDFYKDDKKTISLLKKHFISFIAILHQITNIELYRSGKSYDFQTSLKCILSIAFTEGIKINDLYNVKKMQDYMASEKGKEDVEIKNKKLYPYYEFGVTVADKQWDQGDKCTHGKMAKFVCDIINENLKEEKEQELKDKFHDMARDPSQKRKYDKAIEFDLPHHLMSPGTLKELLVETAIKYGRYRNNTGRGKKE